MKYLAVTLFALFFALIHSSPIPKSTLTGADLSTLSRRQTPELESTTDTLLFSTSMDDFLAAKSAKDPSELDWYSNGCTLSPDSPLGYSFTPSCNRHDFGYRNYKAQGRFSTDNKGLIDLQFKDDLYGECANHSGVSGSVCRGLANIYYQAVNLFGSKKKRALDGGEQ